MTGIRPSAAVLALLSGMVCPGIAEREQRVLKDPLILQLPDVPVVLVRERGILQSAPVVPGPPARLPLRRESVRLLDGDEWGGRLLGMDPKRGIIWKHPGISQELHLDPAQVDLITLPRSGLPPGARAHSGRVFLSNGDDLQGELVSLGSQSLVLDTWYAGRLSIRRDAVRALVPGKDRRVHYSGPTGREDWTFSSEWEAALPEAAPGGNPLPAEVLQRILEKNRRLRDQTQQSWTYQQHAFQSAGSSGWAARRLEIGDRAQLEFDLEWASPFTLSVMMYADNLKAPAEGRGYVLRLSPTQAQCLRQDLVEGRSQAIPIGEAAAIDLGKLPRRARLTLQVDLAKHRVALQVNNQPLAHWTDTRALAGEGRALAFSCQSAQPLRLHSLRVSDWDGRLAGEIPPLAAQGKEDLVLLMNQDSLTGQVLGIQDGKLTVKSFVDSIAVPIERVARIQFSAATMPAAARSPRTIRAGMVGGSRLEFELLDWGKDALQVQSPLFGKAALLTGIVETLEFNLDHLRARGAAPASP